MQINYDFEAGETGTRPLDAQVHVSEAGSIEISDETANDGNNSPKRRPRRKN
jgi:hypothetical protein